MIDAVRIDPEAMYDDAALVMRYGVSPGALDRARRSGQVRYTDRSGRRIYMGSWLLSWLVPDEADARRGVAS